MDDTVDDAAVRAAAFAKVTRADLAHALEQIDLLIRPPGDLYFAELRAQNSKLRFMPALLRAVAFGAAPAGQPVLDAVHHLRANEKRGPSGAAPLAFVPVRLEASGARARRRDRQGCLPALPVGGHAVGHPASGPLRRAQPTLRRPAPRAAVRPGMGGGAARHLPHARPLDGRAGGDCAPVRTPRCRLSNDCRKSAGQRRCGDRRQ